MPRSNIKAEDRATLSLHLDKESRDIMAEWITDCGMPDRSALVRHLCAAYRDGLVMVLNKAAKDVLVGAAEDRMLTIAKRAARDETRWVLYSEGYRATPYDS